MSYIEEIKTFLESRFNNEIKSHLVLEEEAPELSEFPTELSQGLAKVLKSQNIHELFSHQIQAFKHISKGEDTLIVSQTASGKTLSFLLPVLNEYQKSGNNFSVLLLYPTKALSRDQENTLGLLLYEVTGQKNLGTFDGDTPREERTKIQKGADFIVTNPDMLHSGILPNHNRRWKKYLSRLKYIVIDEVHCYRGAFGSHVSNVFRRLLRVCAMHGSSPTIICSSATIGNPGEHVQALFHRPFKIIKKEGSPRPRRDLYFLNPPLVKSQGFSLYRKGTASISIPLIREATKRGIRTICFCRARQTVERLHRAVVDRNPRLEHLVKPYRGGLLPLERRQLEKDLFSGKINSIISTNALELGIDIGDLDLCILSGHPGTVASFWQQAGRVGRKGKGAIIVFIARENPIDQFIVRHPEFICSAPVEEAWLSSNNPYILMQHLPCAAHEHPLRKEEVNFAPTPYALAVDILRDDGTLKPYHGCLRYCLPDYPAKGVNLRGMTDHNIEIYCGTKVIGELDPIGARGTLYKDAIYQHLGRRYLSLDLNLAKKLCLVEEINVDYYTEAVWEKRVLLTDTEEEKIQQGARLEFGQVNVNKQPKLYKKIRERSYENIGYGPITQPPFAYDTMGFSLLPAPSWQNKMEEADKRFISAALFGLAYILKKSSPCLCMGDTRDIDTDVSLTEASSEIFKPSLYLYDSHEGGVGYAEKIFEKLTGALELCLKIIEECECKFGCPACVPPLPPGVQDEYLEELFFESNAARACTISFLKALLYGEIYLPRIVCEKIKFPEPVATLNDLVEHEKLKNRMQRSAKLLQKKREKTH
ncbi:DEAD/DEAH box helicase [Candidatus Riflebacteria bacterium]